MCLIMTHTSKFVPMSPLTDLLPHTLHVGLLHCMFLFLPKPYVIYIYIYISDNFSLCQECLGQLFSGKIMNHTFTYISESFRFYSVQFLISLVFHCAKKFEALWHGPSSSGESESHLPSDSLSSEQGGSEKVLLSQGLSSLLLFKRTTNISRSESTPATAISSSTWDDQKTAKNMHRCVQATQVTIAI